VDQGDLEVVEQEKVLDQLAPVGLLVLLVKVVPVELDMEVHQAVVAAAVEFSLLAQMLIQVVEMEVQEHQMIF
tara:strand:- start:251 stop:469 length:219 start_codon:yes stop_codon:yes gene_type:complete